MCEKLNFAQCRGAALQVGKRMQFSLSEGKYEKSSLHEFFLIKWFPWIFYVVRGF